MPSTSQAAVTPDGVRDGDPAVLSTLVTRRGPAVLAFCEAVCEPPVASRAAAEAFARFRALVTTIQDAPGLDPEPYLLGATRHAAASMARVPSDDRGVLKVLGRTPSPETYAALPALLAARADSMLGADDLERLSRLLERSPGCREVEAAFRRAERGYRSPPDRTISHDLLALVIAAMQAAAPTAPAFAVARPPTATVPPAPVPAPAPAPVNGPAVTADAAADLTARDLPEREQPTVVLQAVPAGHPPAVAVAGDIEAEPPVTPAEAEEPAPFVLEDEYGDAGADDQLHPSVPGMTPVAAELEDAGIPIPAPPQYPRRNHRASLRRPRISAPRLPRVSAPRLPHGGGLHLPRRGSAAAGEDATTDRSVDHGPIYRLLLPTAAIIVAVLVMLAIAGVFGGDKPAAGFITTSVVSGPLAERARTSSSDGLIRIDIGAGRARIA